MNRPAALAMVNDLVCECRLCDLHETRANTVFSRGDGSSGLVVVGEAPGADEDRLGEPFVGASGKMLDKWLVAAGIAPATVYVCNVIKCRPPENRVPTMAEVSACKGYLNRQIVLVRPRVIVTLGATAARVVVEDNWLGLGAIRGRWQKAYNAFVMPTWHPAYVMRKRSVSPDVEQDFAAVAARLKGTAS